MDNQPYPSNRIPAEGQVSNETIQSVDASGTSVESQQERYVDTLGNQVEQRAEVYENENQRRANNRFWTTRITYFVLGVLEVLLLLRFFFRLLGANQSTGFALFLYGLTHVFVVAFNGLFNDQALGKSVFEVSTLIAMIVYALLAWGIVSLGRLVFARTLPGRQSVTTIRRGQPR